jgi:hypothetical protein
MPRVIQTDSSGNRFVEVDLPSDEKLRISLIPQGWAGTPGVRVQARDSTGHLRQGPEIPVGYLGDLVGAVVELLSRQ